MADTNNIRRRVANLSPAKRALLEKRISALGLPPLQQTCEVQVPAAATRSSDEPIAVSTAQRTLPGLPLFMVAPEGQGPLAAWLCDHDHMIEDAIFQGGAILFRGFNIGDPAGFQGCIETISGAAMDYPGTSQGTILRNHVYGKIFTSTQYSSGFRIRLHSECSFAYEWPLRVFFYCTKAARHGGETPIADTRRLLRRIDKKVRQKFEQKGVMYVRNFGCGSAPSWQTVFGTDDRSEVERSCRESGVTVEWLSDTHLRTRSIRPALAEHPVTRELLWFNHVNSAHVESNDPWLRDALLAEFKPEDLPRNCYFGDGSEISRSVLDRIHEAYQHETSFFTWQEGDVLMLDNMLTAHGREPFEGEREVLVGMAIPVRRKNLALSHVGAELASSLEGRAS